MCLEAVRQEGIINSVLIRKGKRACKTDWNFEADLKGCVRYIFANLFWLYKREHFKNKENIFYFTSKALFGLEITKFKLQKFRCHDVIKCLSTKHKTHFTE